MTTDEPTVEHINLIFKGPDDASDVEFKVKTSTKMVKVITAWANKRRVNASAFRFLVHGDRFNMHPGNEHVTVAQLDLYDGDVVEVGTEHVAGGSHVW